MTAHPFAAAPAVAVKRIIVALDDKTMSIDRSTSSGVQFVVEAVLLAVTRIIRAIAIGDGVYDAKVIAASMYQT